MMALVAILCKHFLSTCPVVSCCVFLLDGENKKSNSNNKIEGLDGGDKGSRTPDLLNAIETLYQLSYIPKKKNGA